MWGASFDVNGIDLRYTGMASSASHFPFPDLFDDDNPVFLPSAVLDQAGSDILAPPSGLLGTPDETTVTHRLQISVPLR